MATRVISTSIKLDGEAEFKKQLSEVNSNLKNLNSDMKLVTEEFKGQANSLDALTAKDKILNEQVDQQKEKIQALERALAETTDAYGENDKRVDKYRQSLNSAKADLIKLERELDQNNGYLDEAKKSADGAAKSIDGFGKTVGDSASKVLSFGNLVKANLASDAIISGVKAMGTAIKEAAAAAVELGKESIEAAAEVNAENSQFEQTFGDLGDQAKAAIDRVAESSGILSTRLTSTSSQIYAFARSAGGDTAQSLDIMERALTVAADSAAYYDRSLEDTTETLQSFLKGNFSNDAALGLSVTETTRNAAAMELFGEKYKDLTEIQKQETLLKMVEDSMALSGAMGQAAREAEGWENVQGNLQEALRQTKASIGQELLPAVTKLTTAFTDVLSGDMSSGEFGEVAASVVADLLEGFADQAPELVDAGVEMLQAFLDGMLSGDSPEKIADAMADIMLALIDGGIAMLPDIMKFGIRILTALESSLAEHFPELCAKIPALMAALIETLMLSVPDFLQVGGELISGLYMGIANGITEAVRIVGELGSKLLSKLKEVLGIHSPSREFMTIGEYMMQGLSLGMQNSKGEVMKTADDIVDEVTNRFKKLTNALDTKSSVAELQQQLWDLTEGQTATTQERYDRLLSRFEEQKTLQSGVVDAAKAAYEAVSAQYGENSSEALEYLETLLKEQIAYQEMENDFSEELKDLFDTLADEKDQRASLAESQYSLWENLEGKTAPKSEKYEKQLESLTEQESMQADVVDAAVAAYETLAEQYGENSQQAREWLDTVLEEVEAYQKLSDAIQEVLNKQPKLSGSGYSLSYSDVAGSVLSRLSMGAPSTSGVTSADVYNAAAAVGSAVTQSGSGGSGTTMVKTTISIDSREVAEAITPALRDTNKSNPEVVSDKL